MISKDRLEEISYFYYILYYILYRFYSVENEVGEHLEYYVMRYAYYPDEEKLYNPELMFETQEEADRRCFELNSLYGY